MLAVNLFEVSTVEMSVAYHQEDGYVLGPKTIISHPKIGVKYLEFLVIDQRAVWKVNMAHCLADKFSKGEIDDTLRGIGINPNLMPTARTERLYYMGVIEKLATAFKPFSYLFLAKVIEKRPNEDWLRIIVESN